MATNPFRPGLPASARASISFDELADQLELPDRAHGFGNVPHDETGALQLDGIRKRPRYFDGKFLTAADLTRDQDYIRQRQDDLARATGTGVVQGLDVTWDERGAADTVTIAAGHGVTPSGTIVSVMNERTLSLLNIAESRQLDQVFGLSAQPSIPVSARTGLFMLALRPVEFTANYTGSYPDASGSERTSEPGDIIEATAITLIAYEGTGSVTDFTAAHSQAAAAIFGNDPGPMPQDALLLAMLALDRGTVVWCDPMLVRRETGADSPLALSFSGRKRAVSEAFLLQYQQHLASIMRTRSKRNDNLAFAARDHFSLIPPAGPMPLGSIMTGTDAIEQTWLPAEVDMQVSFVPEDEIGAIIEDSLGLEPIDLARGNMEGLSISVLVPLPRHRLHALAHSLRSLTMPILSRTAFGGRGSVLSSLGGFSAQRRFLTAAKRRDGSILARGEAAQLELWESALQDAAKAVPRDEYGNPVLFYARQRTAPHAATLTGHSVKLVASDTDDIKPDPIDPDTKEDPIVVDSEERERPDPKPRDPVPQGEEAREKLVEEKASKLQLKTRLAALRKGAVPGANAIMTDMLSRKMMNEVFFTNLVKDLETISPIVDHDEEDEKTLLKLRRDLRLLAIKLARREGKLLSKSELEVVGSEYRRDSLGQGLRVIAKTGGKELVLGKKGIWLGNTGVAILIDKLLSTANNREHRRHAKMLAEVIAAEDAEKLRHVTVELIKEIA